MSRAVLAVLLALGLVALVPTVVALVVSGLDAIEAGEPLVGGSRLGVGIVLVVLTVVAILLARMPGGRR
jgi:hypothetical protein